MTSRSSSAVAVDIGGTKIAIGRVRDGRCTTLAKVATPRSGRGDDLVAVVAAHLEGVDGPVGVATTGIVRHGCVTALNPATLSIEDGYPIAERLTNASGRASLVVNDAQAAAWAEYLHGAGQGAQSFVFLTVSTGVGGGIVLDGHLRTGPTGLAGHVGHMVLRDGGPPCGCGRRGCLEALASGTSIAARATETAGMPLVAPDVFDRAGSDPRMRAILDDAASAVAQGIGSLVAALDIDRVVLGGGVGLRAEFLEAVGTALAGLPIVLQRPLVPATTGADAGLIGAASLAMKEFFA